MDIRFSIYSCEVIICITSGTGEYKKVYMQMDIARLLS